MPRLQDHPFVTFYDDDNEEVVSTYVRRFQEHQRIRNSFKRFPSDLSLSSASSGWSGVSAHSGAKAGSSHMTYGHSGHFSSGQYGSGGVDSNNMYSHSLYSHGMDGGVYDPLYEGEGLHPLLHPLSEHGGGSEVGNSVVGGGTFHMDTS